jgi:hypothetical protein
VTVYTPRSITEWPHLRRDNQAREEIAKLEARVRELEAALRYYANPASYETVYVDAGAIARTALGGD